MVPGSTEFCGSKVESIESNHDSPSKDSSKIPDDRHDTRRDDHDDDNRDGLFLKLLPMPLAEVC